LPLTAISLRSIVATKGSRHLGFSNVKITPRLPSVFQTGFLSAFIALPKIAMIENLIQT